MIAQEILDIPEYFQLEAKAVLGPLTVYLGMLTPTGGEALLAFNTNNRILKKQMRTRYTRDMAHGHWLLTHQAIAFDADGALIDGQHRLAALAASGHAVRVLIILGVETEARLAVDIGTKRSTFDIVSITGTQLARSLVSTGISLGMTTRPRPQTERERIAFLREHVAAARFAVESIAPDTPMGSPPVWTVFARAFYTAHRPDLERLAVVFSNGAIEDAGERDLMANAFRNWRIKMAAAKTKAARLTGSDLYWKTEQVVSDYLEHRGKIPRTWRDAAAELFPLPQEQTEAPGDAVTA